MTTGHKIKLDKKTVGIKNGKFVRKTTFRAGVKRRVEEARNTKEAGQWEAKSK